jgi:hypothetical protein
LKIFFYLHFLRIQEFVLLKRAKNNLNALKNWCAKEIFLQKKIRF